jgi:hypothetical protein
MISIFRRRNFGLRTTARREELKEPGQSCGEHNNDWTRKAEKYSYSKLKTMCLRSDSIAGCISYTLWVFPRLEQVPGARSEREETKQTVAPRSVA